MLSCPSAINTHLSVLKTSQNLVRTIPSRSYGVKSSAPLTKGFASSPLLANSKTQKERNSLSSKSEALTLLHKTAKVLPRVIESANGTSGFPRMGETSKTWESILADAHEDLSATSERSAKIVVYALDEWAGTTELVTALLADPLASAEQNKALETRWKERNEPKLSIIPGTNSNPGPSSFQTSSGYLTQFPIPVEITEFRPPVSVEKGSPSFLSQILENPITWEADIPVIVCNPLTTSLPSILDAHLPAHTIVVLSANIAPADLDAIIQNQASRSSTKHSSSTNLPEIISVDPKRALDAIRVLQAEPGSFSAIQKYQAGFVGSRLANVTQALQSRLAPNPDIPAVRTNLALNHISDALRYSLYAVQQMRHETDTAFIDASRLKETVKELQTRVAGDVFGRRDPSTEKIVLNEVDEATKQAEREMRHVLDRLTWWRMIWRIDEISGIICSALRQSWCHGLERKLIMQTGQLSAMQTSLAQSAFTLLATHPTLSTAILQNTLLQLKGSPHYHLTPESLTQPLVTRRNQIIEYPTTRLHATGQRAVLGMTGGILSGISASWAGWLGWMAGSGEGVLGFVGMDAGTAMGVGLLTAVASIRWAIGSWEKSKKRWWQDWARAVEGLDRDLKTTLRKVMRQQVVVVADTASTEMTKIITAREEHLANVGSEVAHLQTTLDNVARGVGQKS